MRTPLFEIQDFLAAFQRKKVLTKKELLQAAGCSPMTAWRLLRQQGYFTSYNENARYYTVVGIPQFDTWQPRTSPSENSRRCKRWPVI